MKRDLLFFCKMADVKHQSIPQTADDQDNPNEFAESEFDELEFSSLITLCVIYFQIEGTSAPLVSVLFCWALQIASITILAMIPNELDNTDYDFQNRDFALIIALFIFICACFGEYFEQNMVRSDSLHPFTLSHSLTHSLTHCQINVRLLTLDGCFISGECDGQIYSEETWFGFNRAKALCILLVVVDTLIWLVAIVVGGRLILLADSLESVILNALAGIFVVEVDDIMARMTLPISGEYATNSVFIQKPNIKSSMYRLVYWYLSYGFIFPVFPAICVVVLYFVPFW